MISIIIPARSEPYLKNTINDILKKATGEIEIKVILDGKWADEYVESNKVSYIHFSEARGMRNAINTGVKVAKGEYILKCDAHVMFSKGFDEELVKYHKDNWVVVPRRYALDVENWQIEKRTDNKYPIDYMYLNKNLNGEVWAEKNKKTDSLPKIDKLMSSQGSCWFMKKHYYGKINLLDEETYGTFWQEFQEIGLKCWLSGGQVMVNKKCYYAHWHKPVGGGRGYKLPKGEKDSTRAMVNKWLTQKMIAQQIHDIKWLVKQFGDVPTW